MKYMLRNSDLLNIIQKPNRYLIITKNPLNEKITHDMIGRKVWFYKSESDLKDVVEKEVLKRKKQKFSNLNDAIFFFSEDLNVECIKIVDSNYVEHNWNKIKNYDYCDEISKIIEPKIKKELRKKEKEEWLLNYEKLKNGEESPQLLEWSKNQKENKNSLYKYQVKMLNDLRFWDEQIKIPDEVEIIIKAIEPKNKMKKKPKPRVTFDKISSSLNINSNDLKAKIREMKKNKINLDEEIKEKHRKKYYSKRIR